MNSVPQLPDNAPFSAEQRAWLNGWIAGSLAVRISSADPIPASAALPAPAALPLTILFGSQTGSAEGLAKKLAKHAATRGFLPTVLGMDAAAALDLAQCSRLLVLTSTYGDGEPPDNAAAFWSKLSNDSAPSLPATAFSVFALGDSNYEKFCAFGQAIDQRLEALGARRIADRVDCDVDYDAPFAAWMPLALTALSDATDAAPGTTRIEVITPTELKEPPAPSGTKSNPFAARLTANELLTTDTAAKETRHFELNINGLHYEPGDALGIFPSNSPELVGAVIEAGSWKADDAATEALTQQFDLTNPSRDLLAFTASRLTGCELEGLLAPSRSADLKAWLHGRDVLDLLRMMPAGTLSLTDFLPLLKKLQPRLYSIASSLMAVPHEVHLTIAQLRYESHGRARHGVCSTFLADRVNKETAVPVFIQPSHGFKLPEDDSKPVIMVGPGTGVAPFRGFLQARKASGARGKNWLFFGEQSRRDSYFYQEEWATLIQKGILHRMDTAFSRDQPHKIYVQDRMLENGAELFRWLQEGAHFYVCGDASRMARDVDAALHKIVAQHGGLGPDNAQAYVASLKEAKRYCRDVY